MEEQLKKMRAQRFTAADWWKLLLSLLCRSRGQIGSNEDDWRAEAQQRWKKEEEQAAKRNTSSPLRQRAKGYYESASTAAARDLLNQGRSWDEEAVWEVTPLLC